jgi:GntR family transcriptional regulator/MocR family aminotransferase
MIFSHDKLALQLEHTGSEALYRQIYLRIRGQIADGSLAPGTRLPSIRSLAAQLGIARGTAEAAYDLLLGEGYLEARGQAGTVVAPHLRQTYPGRPRAPAHGGNAGPQAKAAPLPFQLGLPALDAFPHPLWARLVARRLRAVGHANAAAELDYPDPMGYLPLRSALARYLLLSRGIDCHPGQIIVTSGYRSTLDLVCRSLGLAGQKVWVEDPGYPVAIELLKANQAKLAAIPVDDEGMQVQAGERRAPNARLVLVTPSHQSPLGVSLSLARRQALLAWAVQRQAWVLEDDYDGEYRYQGHPLPALKSLASGNRVLYAGSLSKLMFPGMRLGYLVVPDALLPEFERHSRVRQDGGPQLLQAALADFMDGGHFARHIRKMRSLYRQRREWLLQALDQVFGDSCYVEKRPGGMHLLLRFTAPVDDCAMEAAALAQGLAARALSPRRLQQDCGQALLLSFTNLDSATEALGLVRRLHAALQPCLPSSKRARPRKPGA